MLNRTFLVCVLVGFKFHKAHGTFLDNFQSNESECFLSIFQ